MKFQGKIYKRCRRMLLNPLVTLLWVSLVYMGTLFWVDNSWALIADGDPQTATQIGLLLGGQLDDGSNPELDEDDDGVIPIAGGVLVRGNGDQDDNKEEAFIVGSLKGRLIKPNASKAVSSFNERRTAVAYKDFGHLKVMPAAEAIAVKYQRPFINQRLSMNCGWPLIFCNRPYIYN